MAIVLSQDDYYMLFQESSEGQPATSHATDVTRTCSPQLGQGFIREIHLRDGLELAIANYQCHENILINSTDREHPLEYGFTFSESGSSWTHAIPYHLCGSGIAPGERGKLYANQQIRWINVHIEPEVFRSFASNPDEDIPEALQHLMGDLNKEYYVRPGQATPAMHIAVQQILRCPYQGFTQRIFLESKVLELMTLILEQEIEVQDGKQPLVRLKPEDVDRLNWAKEILHQNLDQPLSLRQLAHEVGLNECTLKQGFRQLFGTTVFGYLRQCRMERARLLLLEGRMNVREAAQAVGYASQSRFASVFRKTFGVNPKAFSIQRSQ